MNKSLLIKIFRLLLATAALAVFSPLAAYAQDGITLKMDNAPLHQAVEALEQQSDYLFLMDQVDMDMPVSIDAENQPIAAVLDKMFKGRDIVWDIQGNNVYISRSQGQEESASAEGNVISGTVIDSYGTPVIGGGVLIKGTTIGASTDLDGKFSFVLPDGMDSAVLEFTCLGYKTAEYPIGSRRVFNVTLEDDSIMMEGTVVTALGIRRAEKALSYNVQEVKSDELLANKDANFVNSLNGKVAGLVINASSSGVGGASKVIMRGQKSIEQSSNALYVIDGVPMYTMAKSAGTEFGSQGATDPIADINPEDIESMTVLTGAAAAALYGSDAANGAIVITTKQGQAGKTSVTISSNTEIFTPFVLPRFQNTYGTDATAPSMSWGAKLDTPSDYDPRDFFQTGFNTTNALSVSGGTERNQTYISLASTNSRGIIPNNVYNRYNVSMRNTTELVKDKLTLDLSASYMKQYKRNPTVQGQYHNPLVPIDLFPRGADITQYQIYERWDPAQGIMAQFWDLNFLDGAQNPYWETNRNLFENTAHRYTLNGTLKWQITDWLSVMGRARLDNTVMNYTRKIYASSNTLFASEYGNYQDNTITHNNFYGDVLLTFDKSFFDNSLSVLFNLGASITDDVHKGTGFEGHLANIPNMFSVNNIDMTHSQTFAYTDRYHDQNQAIYATLQLGYKGMLYLDATFRNEWASQLAFTQHLNIPYPSVGLSAVISSMTDLSKAGISFLKVRASYAEVGNAPQRYITSVNTPVNKGGLISSDTYAPAVNLTPERTKSVEAGLNVKFLDDMIWLDATYYNTNTYNQLFQYDAPPSTGYKQAYINAGKVNNWGIEASLGFKNTWRNFFWSTSFTFSMNRNKIVELVPEGTRDVSGNLVTVDEVNMDYGGYRMKIAPGGSIGDFYVNGLKTDDQGRIYVDPNSNTVTVDANTWIYGGNTEAKARIGWNNQFSWKGINLGILIDARIGGQGVSATQALLDRFGASQASADARDEGGVWISEDQFIPDAKTFYSNSGNGMSMLSHYVYSMTNVRLRELSIGYDFPRSWFKDKLGLSVSLVGRNLWMIYCKAPFDPELTASTGTYYQGLDYFMQPSTRNLGFSVKLQF